MDWQLKFQIYSSGAHWEAFFPLLAGPEIIRDLKPFPIALPMPSCQIEIAAYAPILLAGFIAFLSIK